MIYNKITPETLIYKILEENEDQIRYIIRYFKYIEVRCEYDETNTVVLSHNMYHEEDAVCSGSNIEKNIIELDTIDFDEYYNTINSLIEDIKNSEENVNRGIQSTIINANNIGDPENTFTFITQVNELINKFVNESIDHIYIKLGLNFKNQNVLEEAIIRQLRISVLNYFNELQDQDKLINSLKETSLPIYNDNIVYSHALYNTLLNTLSTILIDELTKEEFSKEIIENNENNIND